MRTKEGGYFAMDSRTTGIVAYLSWIGFIISLVAGDKDDEFAKFHQNQALVLFIMSLLSIIPILGWIVAIVFTVFWFMGLINAINNEMKPLPLIGGIKIIK